MNRRHPSQQFLLVGIPKKGKFPAAGQEKDRVRYTKTGPARFISHLDVVRLFDRAARRAKISLVYSQGFHPRPKLSFGPPLSLGVGSIAEYLDLEVEMDVRLIFSIN